MLGPSESIIPPNERIPLPDQLVEMWTHIDPTLDGPTTAQIIQVIIIFLVICCPSKPPSPRQNGQAKTAALSQETYAAYETHEPASAQPWARPGSEKAASVVAVEKARIAHDGRIPASWRETARGLVHGRKWLAVNKQQREEAEAQRQAEDACERQSAAQAQAEQALAAAKRAEQEAKSAERRAKETSTAANKAAVAARKAAAAAVAAQRKSRAVLASWDSGDAEATAEQTKEKAKGAPRGRKRKATTSAGT